MGSISLTMAPSRSPLWQYFSPTHADGLMVGRCNSCLREIKTKNWSLTGLRKHLQCKHPEQFQEYSKHKTEGNVQEKDDIDMENDADESELHDYVDSEVPIAKVKHEKAKMDKIFLKQNDFPTETLNVFKEMLSSKHFADVTFVTEGFKYIRAHKVIICAFSSVFKDILMNNSQELPCIYLRGVQHEHLEAIINYIYSGETKVSLEDVTEFLNLASELKIVGLGVEQTYQRYEGENQNEETNGSHILTDNLIEKENTDTDKNQSNPLNEVYIETIKVADLEKVYRCSICEYETRKNSTFKNI